MALVWAHGFETGVDYTGYVNDQSTTATMTNEGWRVYCGAGGAPADHTIFNATKYLFTSPGPATADPVVDFRGSYSMNIQYDQSEVGPVSIVEGTKYSEIAINFAFLVRSGINFNNAENLVSFVDDNTNAAASKTLGLRPTSAASSSTFELYLKDGGGSLSSVATSTNTFATGRWHVCAIHYAHTGSTTTAYVYINGNLECTATVTNGTGIDQVQRFEFGQIGTTGVTDPGTWIDSITCWDAPSTDPWKQPHYIFGLQPARDPKLVGNFAPSTGTEIYAVLSDADTSTFGENDLGTTNYTTITQPISSAFSSEFGNRNIRGISVCAPVVQGNSAAGDQTRLNVSYKDRDKLTGQSTTKFNGGCTGGWMMRHNVATVNPWRAWNNAFNSKDWDTSWVRSDLDENLLGATVYSQNAAASPNTFQVAEAALEVVWSGMRSDVSASGRDTRDVSQPVSYIIWPGEGTTEKSNVDGSAPASQAGPFADVAYPVEGNNGSMLVFQHGSWDRASMYAQPQQVQYTVCHGGSLGYIAEYVWKNESDSMGVNDNSWRGFMGPDYVWGTHNPFGSASDDYWWNRPDTTVLSSKVTDGMTVGYSSLYNRLFYVVWGLADSNIVIRYRSTIAKAYTEDADNVVWSQYLLPSRGKTGPTRFPYNRRIGPWGVQPSMIELPDGTLQLYHIYTDESADTGHSDGQDFMIFQSDDGGLTWDLINERVMLNNFSGTQDIRHAVVAASGEWIRFDFYTEQVEMANASSGTAGRQTLVSSDRGATWKAIYSKALNITDDGYETKLLNPLAGSGIPDGSITDSYKSANAYATAAMAGVGDDAGTFIRIHSVDIFGFASSAYGTQVERASRDEAWSRFDAPSAVIGGLPQFAWNLIQLDCVAGGGYIYGFVYATEFQTDEPSEMAVDGGCYYQIPVETISDYRYYNLSLNKWEGSWGTHQKFGGRGDKGEFAHGPAHMRSVWAGDRIVRFYRTVNSQTVNAGGVLQTCFTAHALSTAIVSDFIGGWSQLPLRTKEQYNPLYRGPAAKIRWTPGMGVWNGNTTTYQDFQQTAPGSGSNDFTWNTTQMCADHTFNVTTPTQACTVYVTETLSSVTTYVMDHGVIGMVTRRHPANPVSGGVAATLPDLATKKPAWGIRFRGGSPTFNVAYSGNTQFCDVYVALAKNGAWAIYDNVAGTTLYDSTTASTTFSSGRFIQWRLAVCNSEQLLSNTSTLTDNKFYCRLMYKTEEEDSQFAATPLLTLSTTGSPSWGQSQVVAWGSAQPDSSANTKFQYRELFVNDRDVMGLHEIDRQDPKTYRGAPINAADFAVGSCGYEARWGGASAFYGDTFHGDVAYQYGVGNLNAPSPAQVWRTEDENTEGVVQFHADESDPSGDRYFNHNAIAILNCNVRRPVVSYAATTSFSSPTDYTVDLTKYFSTVAAVSGTGNYFTVTDTDAEKWSDSELVNMYADILYADGTQQTYKVERNTGNRVYLSGLTQSIVNHMSALDTVAFFDGSGATIFGGSDGISAKAMKITIPTANTADGHLRLGGYVAGMTLPFSVPMEWSSQDAEYPRVQMFESDRGTRSAYKQGPPGRVFKGKVAGDASRWRDGFRSMIGEIAGYSVRPVVLVTDHNRPNNSMLYCRFSGTTENDNAAWKYNANTAQWERVGDMKVDFTEEV
jgi:hypothetical protein